MLSRGFYDPIVLWPTLFWPLIFSSCLYAIIKVCQAARADYGASPLDGTRRGDRFILYVFFPAAAVFEVAAHGYLFMLLGWKYLPLVIPIYIFGWVLLPQLLDSLPAVQYLLPGLYLLFAAAFLVLMGFLQVDLLAALNMQVYALLTGTPLPG